MMATRTRRLRDGGTLLAVVGIVALLLPLGSSPAGAGDAATSDGSVTKSKSVGRTFTDDGKTTTIDKRTVKLTVAQTTGLKSLQLVHVSWSGAHPTGGIAPDLNSDLALNEEYPMALFECRGTDSSAHPLSPETCYTQYGDERFSSSYEDPAYPAWRSDSASTAAQRAAFVNRPSKLTDACKSLLDGTTNQRWVPFVGVDGTKYPGGVKGCQGQSPEMSPVSSSNSLSLPTNETYGVTDTDGTGSADFDIFTGEDHASLGCSQTVACSLVAVPIEGISCDAAGSDLPQRDRPAASDVEDARQACEQTGRFTPGQHITPQQSGQAAVDATLWWSASNWRNRISVPLSFAPADNACALDSSQKSVDIYGSELMAQATTSWSPHFCLNSKLFGLNQVQVPEPQARTLLQTQGVEAAFTSEPPSTAYPSVTVNAPVSVTGFAIAYDVDGPDGNQVGHLNLDPRLLAKLLTESYPDQPFIKDAYPALEHNPLNITYDPEFQALNPNVPTRLVDSAATLLTLNTNSDVMYALTSYINADPEARAWLDGKADPWGMVVNPNYKKITLPTDSWPLLDSFEPTDEYQPGRIDCLYANPVPYLPLVAAPTSRLAYIGQDLQFALSQSQTVCQLPSQNTGSLVGSKMVAVGRESVGTRTIFGVVSLGDAKREGLSLASLQSQSSVSPTSAITSTSGRTFVAPSSTSMRAAAATLEPDSTSGVWPIPYSTLRSSTAGKNAYPGTMVVYAAVPTEGLPATDARDLGTFLYFTSDEGQHPGTGQGDLPDGYLPMTSANGLGQLADFTSCAANAVAQQTGKVPSMTGSHCAANLAAPSSEDRTRTTHSGGSPGNKTTNSSGNTAGNTTTGGDTTGGSTTAGGSVTGGGATGGGTQPPNSKTPTSKTSSSSAPGDVAASPVAATTPSVGSGFFGLALPLLFAVAIIGGVGALVTRLRSGGH